MFNILTGIHDPKSAGKPVHNFFIAFLNKLMKMEFFQIKPVLLSGMIYIDPLHSLFRVDVEINRHIRHHIADRKLINRKYFINAESPGIPLISK